MKNKLFAASLRLILVFFFLVFLVIAKSAGKMDLLLILSFVLVGAWIFIDALGAFVRTPPGDDYEVDIIRSWDSGWHYWPVVFFPFVLVAVGIAMIIAAVCGVE